MSSAEWNPLANLFYRKFKTYTMSWQVDLSKYDLISAPFGGPIALTRTTSKLLQLESPDAMPTIEIFTSSGIKISTFLWKQGRIIKMGWSNKEELVIVLEDGTVMVSSLFGEILSQFSMGKEVKEHKVAECFIWGTGVVVMTHQRRFYAVNSFEDPRPRPLHDPNLSENPTSWTVVEPRYSATKQLQVLVATVSGTILVVTQNGTQDRFLSNGPFLKMTLSPQGNMLACFTQNGTVWISPPDFQGVTHTFTTESSVVPWQMSWCGGDSIVCLWERDDGGYILLMVGPHSQYISYVYYQPVYLISEIDGLRIISESDCELWQLVPAVTVKTLQVGSTQPPAMLYDAMQFFEDRSPQSDEFIRKIKDDLSVAVKEIIEASSYEFSAQLQRNLLKAASFGKCFVEFYSPDYFVSVCKDLRVLNAIRHYKIGIPMTIDQYKVLTPRGVIERLCNRHHHLLAFSISNYLKLQPDPVLIHWACTKVKTNDDDLTILNAISNKLKTVPGISYAEIASTAYKFGRPTLATQLLDFEPRAADQVPLLISMKQDKLALKKAIDSGDTDLMYLVLLHIKRTKSPEEFYNIISQQSEAVNLYIAYCKEQDASQLPSVYEKSRYMNEALNLKLMSAFDCSNLTEQLSLLERLAKRLGETKEKAFEKSVVDEQIGLLTFQRTLETSLPDTVFVGKSLADTIYSLIMMNQPKYVQKLKNTFKVPEKRYWWITIRALAAKGAWQALFEFSNQTKKPPVGFGPFAAVCLEYNNPSEAVKYIPKIADPAQRVDFLVRVGAFHQAAIVAAKELKDGYLLESIRRDCAKEDPSQLAQVDAILAKF